MSLFFYSQTTETKGRVLNPSSKNKNMFSELSDHELVDSYQNITDSMAVEMLKAEERRRNSDRALSQTTKSNKIAIGSLIIALTSLNHCCYCNT